MSDPRRITCDEALRLLAAFLDGELQDGAREDVQQHLEICRSCFSRTEFERRLKAEIGRLGWEGASPAFEARVRRLLGSFGASSAG